MCVFGPDCLGLCMTSFPSKEAVGTEEEGGGAKEEILTLQEDQLSSQESPGAVVRSPVRRAQVPHKPSGELSSIPMCSEQSVSKNRRTLRIFC